MVSRWVGGTASNAHNLKTFADTALNDMCSFSVIIFNICMDICYNCIDRIIRAKEVVLTWKHLSCFRVEVLFVFASIVAMGHNSTKADPTDIRTVISYFRDYLEKL